MPKRDIHGFIAHWSAASPSERANSQAFLLELCDLLEVPAPDNHPNAGYFFEYPVTEQHPDGTASTGRIDLYKRACFVLESKQFQEAQAEASQLELAAEAAGVVAKKKSSQPVRGTDAWDDAMIKARGQAERYVRALPNDNPPFVIVVDVGHTFELFADFSQAGKAYLPFPDPRTFRIRLKDLADEKIRARLRLVWTDPAALDPAKRSADVTREVSAHLAELAKSLEQAGHEPDVVAQFLTRCLFCMFAEDIELLPRDSFRELLESLPADGAGFEQLVQQLFREMNTGTGQGISVVLRKKLLHFNGGLFADDTVLPINGLQLGLLKEAARQHWASVEPAIFGTLLVRALDPVERHKLGAHFTPRAYVERLVLPTVIEPLRAEWENVRAAAITHARAGDLKKARVVVNAFHERLCRLTVLDPACGVGNFLYVTLQHLKILEGEVLDFAAQFGDTFKLELATHTIDPHQFLGLEINPRAAAIAELVLWIGYLQWHFKLHGKRTPPEPILRAFKNIQCRDAVLAYDGDPQPVTWAMAQANPDLPGLPEEVREKLRSAEWHSAVSPTGSRQNVAGTKTVKNSTPAFATPPGGLPTRDTADCQSALRSEVITVWDRRSMKTDLVTGREVPDETKRVPLLAYANPRPAEWPAADFLVGNPPFIGNKRMRDALGDGYAVALRAAYPSLSETADFVMYWWHKAAELARLGRVHRFGLITTNSLRMIFNSRVVQTHLNANPPLSLAFAIPDHPWVDTAEGAAVRIAMTVGVAGRRSGDLLEATGEVAQDDGSVLVKFSSKHGSIQSDLSVGVGLSETKELRSNSGLSFMGVIPVGLGFVIEAAEVPKLGFEIKNLPPVLRPYLNGRDLTGESRAMFIIDFFGLTQQEARQRYPSLMQVVIDRVKSFRDTVARKNHRENWWIYGEARPGMRKALAGLPYYIGTAETAKHRTFIFVPSGVLPDQKIRVIASCDAFVLGVLSSRAHVCWALAIGGTLEDRPVYNNTTCFDRYPFPLCGEAERERIRKLAEELDAHRKRVQAQHGLTLTGLYNVLEKLRAAESARPVPPHPDPLPPGEGTAASESRKSTTPDSDPALRRFLPLPGGEGRGEGERPRQSILTAKEKLIHDQGLVSVLKQLHDDLDAAVFAAYGWVRAGRANGKPEPENLTDQEILERLVALNAERAAEEKRGIIHWLRPEYQARDQKAEGRSQKEMELPAGKTKPQARKSQIVNRKSKIEWPKTLADRVKAVEALLHAAVGPTAPADLATQFKRAKPSDVAEILETLATLGRAHRKGNQFTR
jgi:hypothetical protein